MTRPWNLKKNKDEGNTETEGEGGSRFCNDLPKHSKNSLKDNTGKKVRIIKEGEEGKGRVEGKKRRERKDRRNCVSITGFR